jgi:ABC-2 type transport system permease protein
MSRGGSAVMHVAHWEFRRYFRPRQQLVGMLMMLGIGYAMLLVGPLRDRSAAAVQIEVAGADVLPLASFAPDRFVLVSIDAVDEQVVERVSTGRIDGALDINSADDVRLHVRRQAAWQAQLQAALTAARQQLMLETAGMTTAQLVAITAPPRVEVVRHNAGAPGSTRGERIFFAIAIGIMLMAVFTGIGYIFASITGEKQTRVTEQVLAAIPAQQWIDGKILGIAALSVVTVSGTLLSALVLLAIVRAKGIAVPLPDSLGDPVVLATTLVFTVLGLFLWLSFLAAIAAMIDDPHTSSRGSLLMVPVFATSMAFLAIRGSDTVLVRALSLFPATSPSMMPARLMVTGVPAWEVALSVLLLAATCLLLRTAAGRVFRLAMLMYGKEPSWAEVRRWALSLSVILAIAAVPAVVAELGAAETADQPARAQHAEPVRRLHGRSALRVPRRLHAAT